MSLIGEFASTFRVSRCKSTKKNSYLQAFKTKSYVSHSLFLIFLMQSYGIISIHNKIVWFIFGSFSISVLFFYKILLPLHPMNEQNAIIRMLIHAVEQKVGRAINSPKDFEFLQKKMPANNQLSMSTLKRLWNYVPSSHIPRECTLSILSQFVGYQDWDDFYKKHENLNDSDFLCEMVKIADLTTGSEIYLEWNPDRRCLLQKEADGSVKVLGASNCKLQIGDTFNTVWLSVSQPLYATRLIRNGKLLPDYVAGRREGLTKVMIK